jgi:hypothetical protein
MANQLWDRHRPAGDRNTCMVESGLHSYHALTGIIFKDRLYK